VFIRKLKHGILRLVEDTTLLGSPIDEWKIRAGGYFSSCLIEETEGYVLWI